MRCDLVVQRPWWGPMTVDAWCDMALREMEHSIWLKGDIDRSAHHIEMEHWRRSMGQRFRRVRERHCGIR